MGRKIHKVKRNQYEITFIVRIDPSEEVMREAINQVQAWIEQDGTVNRVDHWGRRRLAYEIDGQREGYYVLFEADINPAHIDELERSLRLSTEIIRHLIIRPD